MQYKSTENVSPQGHAPANEGHPNKKRLYKGTNPPYMWDIHGCPLIPIRPSKSSKRRYQQAATSPSLFPTLFPDKSPKALTRFADCVIKSHEANPRSAGRGMGMAVIRLAGQGASSRKYDILTAIGAAGLARTGLGERTTLRLIVLITARYDWQADRLATGQREIAALWSVDERTVKREMSRLRECGWLVLQRQGGRGRVAEYGLGMERILADTAPHWAAVGRDLASRLSNAPVPAGTSTIVPFPQPEGDGPWDRVLQHFAADAPLVYSTWLRQLRFAGMNGQDACLEAPSRFHATYVNTHLALRILAELRRHVPEAAGLRLDAVR